MIKRRKLALIIIIIIMFIIYIFYRNYDDKTIFIRSRIDNKPYEIRDKELIQGNRGMPRDTVFLLLSPEELASLKESEESKALIEYQESADRLAELYANINIVVNYMNQNKIPTKEASNRLFKRWSRTKLRESSINDSVIAATIDKGSEIRICLRNNNNNLEDFNTSIYIMLHELAHVMTISMDHSDEFKANFKYILAVGIKLGIYKPHDYNKNPRTYCGKKIIASLCSQGICSS